MAVRRGLWVVIGAVVLATTAPPAAARSAAPAQAEAPASSSLTCDTDRNPLPASLGAELAARYPGRRFTAAVLDSDGCAYDFNPQLRLTTASVVKLEVMTGVLLRAQRAGRGVTQAERDLIFPMITQSANPPTTQLWTSLGGAPAMEALDAEFGMTATVHASPRWGLTTTSAADQVHLMRQVWTGNAGPLGAAMRAEARGFLTSVVPEQRWGASAGVPAGWTVGQKNGFAVDSCCRWRLNTSGWIERPDGTGWAVTVLTDGWATEAEGIAAVDELTGRINQAMLEPSFTGPGIAVDGAGRADTFARSTAGSNAQFVRAPGGAESGWLDAGGRIASDVDAVTAPSPGGTPEAVARGLDGQPWRYVWGGTGWTVHPLGGSCSSGPSATYSGTARFDVFCRGTDGQLWTVTWTGAGGWGSWGRVGGRLSSDPDAASPGPGGPPQVYVRGLDDAVWQFAWDGSSWQAQSLGGVCSSGPSAAYSGADRVDVFCRGTDMQLWTRTWHRAAGWVGWSQVGGRLASDPDAASRGAGHGPQVVVRGVDQGVWRFTSSANGWSVVPLGHP